MPGTGGFARRPEHPYPVKSLENLPDELQQLAEQTIPEGKPVNMIYVIPEQQLSKDWSGLGGVHQVPVQALLFTPHGVIHVQAGESSAEIGRATYLPGDCLLYARMIMVLVYGRIELFGVVDNALTQIVAEYNSVSYELLQPELYNFLRLAWRPAGPEKSHKAQPAVYLSMLYQQSDKFGNGLKHYSLQDDEQLLGYVFQPARHKPKFASSRTPPKPGSLLTLTDRQLILIEEGISSAMSYGYFITWCPIANVTGVETRPNDTRQDVCVHLRKGAVTAEIQLTQDNPNALACEALWSNRPAWI